MLVGAALLLSAHAAVSEPVPVLGTFEARGGDAAKDISGVACSPAAHCIVIDDDAEFAQVADFAGAALVAGDRIPLGSPSRIFGRLPPHRCISAREERALSGEAAAFAAPYFYVAGSHGCSRKRGTFSSSSFRLTRFRLDDPRAVEATHRLAEALASAVPVGAQFGKPLTPSGLNIGGIAVMGDNLLVGLRAPTSASAALVLKVNLFALFSEGAVPPATPAAMIFMERGGGIHDLAALPDGRLLVLSGPAQDQDVRPAVWLLAAGVTAPPRKLYELGGDLPGVAEALLVRPAEDGSYEIIVFFDGPKNGGPVRLPIRVPPVRFGTSPRFESPAEPAGAM